MTTLNDLIEKLAKYGGKIVLAKDCSTEDDIVQGRASNRLATDCNGIEFLWEPVFKSAFPITEDEVRLWDECYPLDMMSDTESEQILDKVMKRINEERNIWNDSLKKEGLTVPFPVWMDEQFKGVWNYMTPSEKSTYNSMGVGINAYNFKNEMIKKYEIPG